MRTSGRNTSKALALIVACIAVSPLANAQESDADDLPFPTEPWLVVTSDGDVIDTSQYTVTRIDDQREVIVLDDSSALVGSVEPWDPATSDGEVTDPSASAPTRTDDQREDDFSAIVGSIEPSDPAPLSETDPEPSVTAVSANDPTQDLVFGTDTRMQVSSRVYPYSAIVRIITDNTAEFQSNRCTGTLISPRVVLTAGHCVYNTTKNKWLPAATVQTLLGFNGQELADSIKVRASSGGRYHSLTCFTSAHDRECDVGVIRLDQPINAGRTGLIGWYFNTKDSVWTDGTPYWVSGYPGMVKSVSNQAQWSSGGPIMQAKTRSFRTQIDSSGGQSGEPLYYKGCPFNCNGPFLIVGVDAHDITVNNVTKWNEAIRITPWLSNILATWAALP
jgi:V8-like Glu-specific endopeptidase